MRRSDGRGFLGDRLIQATTPGEVWDRGVDMTEAEAVVVQGFLQTIQSLPGIAWDLEAKLVRIAEKDRELPLAAAYRTVPSKSFDEEGI